MQYRHAEGAARRRGQRGLPVHAQPPRSRSRTSTRHSGTRRGPHLRGAQHRERLLLPQQPPAVHRGGPALERGRPASTSSRALAQQPHRLARATCANAQPRRAGPARDALPVSRSCRHARAHRQPSCSPTSRRAASACSTTLDDETIDVAANWSAVPARRAAGRRSSRSACNYVDRTRDFQSRRFRFIPIVAHQGRRAGGRPDR